MFYVYVYLDPRKGATCGFDHEPFYVGKGKGLRDREHIRTLNKDTTNRHKSNRIKAIIAEGLNPIIVRVWSDLQEEEAYSEEIRLISAIGRADLGSGPLLNLTDGGDGSRNMSEAGRKRLSERMQGDANPNFAGEMSRGRKRPDNTGRPHTEASKRKVALARQNDSEETKIKRSESFKRTWEEKREQWCGTYLLTDPEGTEYEVRDGLDRFLAEKGLNQSIISKMIREPDYTPIRGQCRGWTAKRL